VSFTTKAQRFTKELHEKDFGFYGHVSSFFVPSTRLQNPEENNQAKFSMAKFEDGSQMSIH
jgi:hypothetical protein